MNLLNEVTDEEFVPFLQSLGVDTYKKSFEWMLNDPDFSGVLRWLHNNLDHNNALTGREEYRYSEIEKANNLLSPEDLEAEIRSLQDEYEGLPLPGDQDAVDDIKLDINRQKEKLHLLEKQEFALNELIQENKFVKEELEIEVTKLNSVHQQYLEDEATKSEQCLQLATEVETITEGVVDVIADTLEMYSNCNMDKDISSKFFTFGPYEAYRQSQALFRSHFDLYTSKKFSKRRNDDVTDEDLKKCLIEAKSLEGRLSNAVFAYIESKANLSAEQAKLALVESYNNMHPSQITPCLMEAQSAVELLEQEENILEQELNTAVKQLVDSRTKMAVDATARSALLLREQVFSELCFLSEVTARAVRVDRALYCGLRRELRAARDAAMFASQLRAHRESERAAAAARLEYMIEICSEHEELAGRLQSSDPLMNALSIVLGVSPTNDVPILMKLHNELQNDVAELKCNVVESYQAKELALEDIVNSSRPLKAHIYDGCTKQANCRDRKVASLSHALRHDIADVDALVVNASGAFANVKNGDKKNLRKLWQWFLTDPAKLTAVMNHLQGRSYS